MLRIVRNSVNTIYPTFTERMQNPESSVKMRFINEMDNNDVLETDLGANLGTYTFRNDVFVITDIEDPVASMAEIQFTRNGFYEYQAFEILPDDELHTIEIGRCQVIDNQLPESPIDPVYQ